MYVIYPSGMRAKKSGTPLARVRLSTLWAGLTGVIAFLLVTPGFAADPYRSELDASLHHSKFYRLRYFDPAVSPRSPYDVDDINMMADYDVTIRCQFLYCDEGTRILATRLRSAQPATTACIGRPFGKLEFKGEDGTIILTLLFDYTGQCISWTGRSYLLPKSLLWELNQTAVSKW